MLKGPTVAVCQGLDLTYNFLISIPTAKPMIYYWLYYCPRYLKPLAVEVQGKLTDLTERPTQDSTSANITESQTNGV